MDLQMEVSGRKSYDLILDLKEEFMLSYKFRSQTYISGILNIIIDGNKVNENQEILFKVDYRPMIECSVIDIFYTSCLP